MLICDASKRVSKMLITSPTRPGPGDYRGPSSINVESAIFYFNVLKYPVKLEVGTNPMPHVYCLSRNSPFCAPSRRMSILFSFHCGVRLNGHDAPSNMTDNGLYRS